MFGERKINDINLWAEGLGWSKSSQSEKRKQHKQFKICSCQINKITLFGSTFLSSPFSFIYRNVCQGVDASSE